MADKSINNSDKSYSVDVSRVTRSHDQEGRHAHIWQTLQKSSSVVPVDFY